MGPISLKHAMCTLQRCIAVFFPNNSDIFKSQVRHVENLAWYIMYDIFFPLLVTRHALCFFSTLLCQSILASLHYPFGDCLTQKQESSSLYQKPKPLSRSQMVFFESTEPMLSIKQPVLKHVDLFQTYDLTLFMWCFIKGKLCNVWFEFEYSIMDLFFWLLLYPHVSSCSLDSKLACKLINAIVKIQKSEML